MTIKEKVEAVERAFKSGESNSFWSEWETLKRLIREQESELQRLRPASVALGPAVKAHLGDVPYQLFSAATPVWSEEFGIDVVVFEVHTSSLLMQGEFGDGKILKMFKIAK